MSADNGIYILKTKDQYRVVHAQAIDNLNWSFKNLSCDNDLVPTRIVEYFGNCDPIKNEGEAIKIAHELKKTTSYLEYGICTIAIDKTWKEIFGDARKYARLEIEAIKKNPAKIPFWEHSLSNLEKMLKVEYI
jgi:hypothetical protein